MQQTKIAITTAVQLAGINSPVCYSLGYYLLISNSAPSDELWPIVFTNNACGFLQQMYLFLPTGLWVFIHQVLIVTCLTVF